MKCPRHPTHRADDCPQCEYLIGRAELERDDPHPDAWQRGQDEYERQLQRQGVL